ncbi:MAG: ligase-associated DNA damage response exonuclease [Hyphomonadaceae bacterium]|jgi:putative mRNA 3-end processing factor|nr:ligase-associated DNA damage response exonuclease [Hyphomonadaceae bacterium]
MPTIDAFETWLRPDAAGLCCIPGGFHVDPARAVERAIITHGHSDHARSGHGAVLATPETIAIMQARLGETCAGSFQALRYGETLDIGDVALRLVPAGHILGSAQVVIEHKGRRAVVSGDYKRAPDPTAAPFELVRCDLLVTEATFGLPVFRHEPDAREIGRLLASLKAFPERTHVIGAYSLGKAQRLIALLRAAGYDRPVWLHGALKPMCDLYVRLGIDLGQIALVSDAPDKLPGEIVLCPPSALKDRWSRRLTDPVTAYASGWMRVRARARQVGAELPLVISDHSDWPELIQTIAETGAEEVWVTHGREDALVHQIGLMGKRGRALALLGYEDEDGE